MLLTHGQGAETLVLFKDIMEIHDLKIRVDDLYVT